MGLFSGSLRQIGVSGLGGLAGFTPPRTSSIHQRPSESLNGWFSLVSMNPFYLFRR